MKQGDEKRGDVMRCDAMDVVGLQDPVLIFFLCLLRGIGGMIP